MIYLSVENVGNNIGAFVAAYQELVLDVVRKYTWLNLVHELIRSTLSLTLIRLVLFLYLKARKGLHPSYRKCSEYQNN